MVGCCIDRCEKHRIQRVPRLTMLSFGVIKGSLSFPTLECFLMTSQAQLAPQLVILNPKETSN
jgi:hypothetical protein